MQFGETTGSKYPPISSTLRDTSNYLYYKLDRKLQSSTEKGNKIKNDIPNTRCLIQDAVSGNDGHHEKVGRKTMELGSNTGAVVYIL